VKIPEDLILDVLKSESTYDIEAAVYSAFDKVNVTIKDIQFPARDGRDLFDYVNILEKPSGIHFMDCTFKTFSLPINKVELFFDSCKFYNNWFIQNHKLLDNYPNVLYQQCIFHNSTSISSTEEEELKVIDNNLFSDCTFLDNLSLNNTIFKKPIFKNTNFKVFSIESLTIRDSIIKDRFLLNSYELAAVNFENTMFEEKVELKENEIQQLELSDCNFNKLADFFESTFQNFIAHKCIFFNFAGFENCKFGINEDVSSNLVSKFNYVTFLDFVNFRNTTFYSGLNIANINYSIPPNFLNVSIEMSNTNRETFRIIKNSFDNNGNFIEGNKYYVNEMIKFREEAINAKNTSTRFLLFIYRNTSEYGQSYTKPILYIISTSILYWLSIIGYENNWLYQFTPSIDFSINYIAEIANGVASHIIPFSHILREGMEFISLLFYVSFTSFIWLIILAIKRNTKR
jgi:hypothetical protein